MVPGFSERLLSWFDQHGRKNLPWQQDISPYRVWVSEIMLQQTQVTTVIPYFEKFIQRFPIVNALADASEDEVLHLWTGLGYYARARNMHRAGKIITTEHNGQFPDSLDALVQLPGIGRSTAGAILAIAHGQQATILDGNVKRVLARCYAIEGWPGQTAIANQLWTQAENLTPKNRSRDYAQAIMDIGATLCTRSKPRCDVCPFDEHCLALLENRIDQLPGKKPKKNMPEKSTCMLLIENSKGEWLLHKRPNSGLWGGLWSFPECAEDKIDATLANLGIDVKQLEPLSPFRHTFTHFHLDISPILVISSSTQRLVDEPNRHVWYSLHQPLEIGLTRPVTKIIEQFGNGPL